MNPPITSTHAVLVERTKAGAEIIDQLAAWPDEAIAPKCSVSALPGI